ncbi:MAG: Uma2 family endonuclease [Myxococcales bacterium]|nr:Uma2 family endonuclease [Myxococcales bacterium]
MAQAPELRRMTYPEYLELERASATKHEYVNGEVYAMAGGSPEHARLAMRLGALITVALGGRPCAVFSSDARVRVERTSRSTYPDLSVVCGTLERASDDPDAIVNPCVLVEVLSETTEASDRGDKWAHYQRLDSLAEYVLVSQREPRVELYRRAERGWSYEVFVAGMMLELRSIGVSIDIDALYLDPLA